jgi:hypothetical protein
LEEKRQYLLRTPFNTLKAALRDCDNSQLKEASHIWNDLKENATDVVAASAEARVIVDVMNRAVLHASLPAPEAHKKAIDRYLGENAPLITRLAVASFLQARDEATIEKIQIAFGASLPAFVAWLDYPMPAAASQ